MNIGRIARTWGLGSVAVALLATSVPALAQDNGEEMRIRRLEQEVKALQRKVFPGADGRYFEPEISATPSTGTTTVPTNSTTAVTDILARLDALEAQLQRQTAQNEENANTLRVLGERIAVLEAGGVKPAVATNTAPATETIVSPSNNAVNTNVDKMTGNAPPAKPATGPSAERLAAVQAIAKPQTDDAGDDEYSYGFRLWNAGFFPEAAQQLTMFVEKYPKHSRISYGRNLLGRAYLNDGKAREAAPWFLKNYQSDKQGARAGDSLLYLAEAMIQLKDTKRACIALAEFSETYPALATGRLASDYAARRDKVKCG
ncbi:tol-pal system YbgF family protein [Qipengyuania sp. RANM35]|uniref:tetratricopeptide repeat protein n=1 Tax=Qipengyuania sp. RANM35 TaxID=3068635 RepID=UPI0034DB2F7F